MMDIDAAGHELKQTAFIVEDDPAIGEALCDLLDSAGVAARCFASAEEFTDAWNPAIPGCLVLDVGAGKGGSVGLGGQEGAGQQKG